MNQQALNFIGKLHSLKTLPTVYLKVNEQVNDPNCPASRLGETISNDQAITSLILRLVNSALYGFPTYIDTVTKSVTLIGFKQTRDLVLASSVIDMFAEGDKDAIIDFKGFWEHSIATAICAKVIASKMKKCDPESMFTAGLLHDIGRLIIMENHKKLPVTDLLHAIKNEKKQLYKSERKAFGFTHGDIAEALFSKWNLPPILKEAAVFHHAPTMAPRFREEACCIHIADAITHAMRLGNSGDCYVPVISEEAWESLNIPLSELSDITSQVCSKLPGILSIFFQGNS